jgi:hypothetical protein
MRQRRENVSKLIGTHKSTPNKKLNVDLSEPTNSNEISNLSDENNEVRIGFVFKIKILYNIFNFIML